MSFRILLIGWRQSKPRQSNFSKNLFRHFASLKTSSYMAVVIALAGCASPTPVSQFSYSAEEQLRDKDKLIEVQQKYVEQAKAENIQLQAQVKEIERLKEENKKIVAEAEKQKKDCECKLYIAVNKPQFLDSLTKEFYSNRQSFFEQHGFKGVILDFQVVDAEYEKGILYYRQAILWRKADNSGTVAYIDQGFDQEMGKVVSDKIVRTKDFTDTELKELMNGNQTQAREKVTAASSVHKLGPSFYEGVRNDIGEAVGEAVLTYIFNKLIDSQSK